MPSKPSKKSSLGELMKKSAAQAPAAPRKVSSVEQPRLVVRSISLTPAASASLDALISEASTRAGRKVSASAVVRALLRLAEQRRLSGPVATQVEAELNTGEVIWGRPR
jgi:Arc/MetJ-type ribon-helix-helix transcriptional regulator